MRVQRALRLASRARSINHVREIFRRSSIAALGLFLVRNLVPILIEHQYVRAVGRKVRHQTTLRQQYGGASIGDHERHSFRRIVWIDGDISATSLERT